jgi:hypothetical protein
MRAKLHTVAPFRGHAYNTNSGAASPTPTVHSDVDSIPSYYCTLYKPPQQGQVNGRASLT